MIQKISIAILAAITSDVCAKKSENSACQRKQCWARTNKRRLTQCCAAWVERLD
jgi:hypothetical protein